MGRLWYLVSMFSIPFPGFSMMLRPLVLIVAMMITNDDNKLGIIVPSEPSNKYLIKRVILNRDAVEAISRDGWATNSRNEIRKVWNPFDTKTKPAFLDGVRVSAFAFGDTHDTVYAADLNGNVYQWNPPSTKRQILFTRGGEQGNNVVRIRVSSAAGLLVAGCYNGRVHCFWDLEGKKEVHRVETWISALTFSPNGKLVALRSERGLAALNSKTFEETWNNPLKGNTPGFGGIEFSPDGKFLIVGGFSARGAMIHLLASEVGKPIREPIFYNYTPPAFRTENKTPTFPAAQISPGGLFLASSFNSPAIDLWEMATMRKAISVAGHRDCTNIVFCSSTRLVTTGDCNEVCLWDLAEAAPFKQFREQGAGRKELAWDALKSLDPLYGVAATKFFCANPMEFLSIVRERPLIPVPPSGETVKLLIKKLDHSAFLIREKAQIDLIAFGELVESPLREALKEKLSVETRSRIETILASVPNADGMGPHVHRQLRAILVLEKIGTPECKSLLMDLERNAPNSTVTARARESQIRLTK